MRTLHKTTTLPTLGLAPRPGRPGQADVTPLDRATWSVGDRVERLPTAGTLLRAPRWMAQRLIDQVEERREILCSPGGRALVAAGMGPEVAPVVQAVCGLTPLALQKVRERLVSPDLYRATANAVAATGQAPKLVEHLRAAADRTERMETGGVLGGGELGVDAAAMWKLATEKLYQNSDLIALATREAMQNGVDAVRMAYRARGEYEIPRGTGFFSVTLTRNGEYGDTGTLTFEDNGVGMDETVLRTKFLTLGGTGKSAETGGDVAGGFGMAKAVILGVTPTGRWEVHTRDLGVKPIPGSLRYNIYQMPPRQGTKIVLYDVPWQSHWYHVYHEYLEPLERASSMLAFSDVSDLALTFNGAPVEPKFPRTKGRYLDRFGSPETQWGQNNDVKVKNYRRPRGEGSGIFYIRLAGLFQFAIDPSTGISTLPSDVVIDITTTNRPQDREYPLNASRDSWNAHSSAQRAYQNTAKELVQEFESARQPKEWETLLPTSSDPREREGGEEFARAVQDVFQDPAFSQLMSEALNGVADYYRTQDRIPGAQESAFADESQARGTGEASAEEVYETWREAPPGSTDFRKGLAHALVQLKDQIEKDGGSMSSYSLEGALGALERGDRPEGWQVSNVLDDIVQGIRRMDDAVAQGTASVTLEDRQRVQAVVQGLTEAATAGVDTDGYDVRAVEAKALKERARKINPFGSAGAVKINLTNYDRADIRKFMGQVKAFIPYLALWDIALQIVVRAGGIKERYKPGFVLDHTVRGIATSDGDPGSYHFQKFVMIEPYKLREVIRAHKTRPWGIAAYLHQIASHELTHLPRLGFGHDEKWAIEREDLATATAHMIPAIEQAVVKLLKLKTPQVLIPREEIRRIQAEERARVEQRAARTLATRVAKVRQDDEVRCDRIVSDIKTPLFAVVKHLQGLIHYHGVRAYIQGPGRALLPRGVSPELLLQVLDRSPQLAADALLDESLSFPESSSSTSPRARRAARRAALMDRTPGP